MKSRRQHRWVVAYTAGLSALVATADLNAQCQVASLNSASINYCVHGFGSPTIVLAAGAGMSSSTWAAVTPGLTELGTVVAFDRPGLGRSPPASPPRTPGRISHELVELLEHADLPGPFVFVGHSMGGIHVTGAAALIPDRTGAVVLLDSPHPDFETRRVELLSPHQRQQRSQALSEGLDGAPAVVRDERAGATAQPMHVEADVLGSTPLIVVVANRQDFGPERQQAHRDLWLDLSHELLQLSSNARLIIAEGSGHMVHLDRTELLLELLRSVTLSLR